VIDDAQIRSWAAEQGFQLDADLTRDERVRELVQGELDRLAQDFRPYERPRDCLLTDSPFTIENGLLTPSLKLKRRAIETQFANLFDTLYVSDRPHAARRSTGSGAIPSSAAPPAM